MAVTIPAVDTAMSTEADTSKSQSTENVLASEKAAMPTFGPHTDTNLHNVSHTPFSSSCLASFQADAEVRLDHAEPEDKHFLREAVANPFFVTNSRTKLLRDHLRGRLHDATERSTPREVQAEPSLRAQAPVPGPAVQKPRRRHSADSPHVSSADAEEQVCGRVRADAPTENGKGNPS